MPPQRPRPVQPRVPSPALALALVALLALSAPGAARAQQVEPRRPRLAREDEPRDAQAYLNCAVSGWDLGLADGCAWWAYRLDPERAEASFLRYAISGSRDTAALRVALTLDPFLFQTRFIGSNVRPGQLSKPRNRAWAYLRSGDFPRASAAFAAYLPSAPGDWESHYGAAIAHHYRGRHDSVVVHLRVVADSGRGRVATRTANYIPPDIARFAIARSWDAAGQPDSARATLERLLADRPGFAHARQLLGQLRLAAGDTSAAMREGSAALAAAGDDPVVPVRHARLLARMGRAADAVPLLQAAVEAEPHWSNARRELALALEAAGPAHRAAAIDAWEAFLERAPRLPMEHRREAEAHLAALRLAPSTHAPD